LAHRSLSSVAAPTSGRALKFAESARSAKGVVEPLGGAASCLTTQVRGHRGESLLGADFNAETITVTFIDKDGEEEVIEAPVGKSLLEIAHMNDIELEGACEGKAVSRHEGQETESDCRFSFPSPLTFLQGLWLAPLAT